MKILKETKNLFIENTLNRLYDAICRVKILFDGLVMEITFCFFNGIGTLFCFFHYIFMRFVFVNEKVMKFGIPLKTNEFIMNKYHFSLN